MPSEHSDLVVSRQDDFIASHSATMFNKNQVPGPANVYHAPDSDAESSSTVTTDSNSSVTTVDWEKFWAAVNEMNAPVASFIGKMWNGFREDRGKRPENVAIRQNSNTVIKPNRRADFNTVRDQEYVYKMGGTFGGAYMLESQ